MQIRYFHVDSFTNEIFHGNPAGVCILPKWLPDKIMCQIARENALPETAFVVKENETYHIKWFTPDIEMDLCGHATLAAAFVVNKFIDSINTIIFQSISGELKAVIDNDLISLSFPKRTPIAASAPDILLKSVNIKPAEIYKSRDYIFIYDSEKQIRDIKVDLDVFNQINLDPGGLCVTAKGDNSDFVSRYFTPQSTILEDPVTGSSHCSLIPLWSNKMGKNELIAMQLSERGGKLICKKEADHVVIAGNAVIYKEGVINLS
ncbi:PhzF family phenazine biosynthesis protein [Iodobacter fluviatilis]|uniref:PhzF family phenazine biosynthesis protein n=2 Tax=Iodobacter fluviatilis TaxID=537 RepID=A0A377Q4T9_9NEIS|nr:PhzF family phenazine biosynthesis protein [Iodobacter fluviatilis]STQ90276.1 Uncharacterized isomerase yddE [Iodobacter fluviatilis]